MKPQQKKKQEQEQKEKVYQLVPALTLKVKDKEIITIGGLDTGGLITEVNFYSKMNSFAMKADITIVDVDNVILNRIFEPHGIVLVIHMYERPEEIVGNKKSLKEYDAKKLFQLSFTIDSIDVLKFGTSFPFKSTIKLNLTDSFETLILKQILTYSNFNLKWDSKEMEIEPTLHKILELYENEIKEKLVIPDPEEFFGVDPKLLKRRFVTDCSTTTKEVFEKYIDGLYNTRWREYLSNSEPEFEIPKYLVGFSSKYLIDDDGIVHSIPYLTTVNMLDEKPDAPLFSIPYEKTGIISHFAKKDYDINVDNVTIDLRGGPTTKTKEDTIADSYIKHVYNPKQGFFEDGCKTLKELTQLNPPIDIDCESTQKPKYLGKGKDPVFEQVNYYDDSLYLEYPYNIKDNKYYVSTGENSFYKDMCDLLMKPMIYVSIPFSAWHTPGQEIDLRMTSMGNDRSEDKYKKDWNEMEKETYYSMNKLISGRWKIVNCVTRFLEPKGEDNALGITPTETLGLVRPKYFHEPDRK